MPSPKLLFRDCFVVGKVETVKEAAAHLHYFIVIHSFHVADLSQSSTHTMHENVDFIEVESAASCKVKDCKDNLNLLLKRAHSEYGVSSKNFERINFLVPISVKCIEKLFCLLLQS